MKPELIEKLKRLASRDCWSGNAYDMSGGNYDDAYSGGLDDGETYLAREVLTALGIEWK